MTPILDVNQLTMRFGGLVAVDNVTFDLSADQILAVIGPNGAGKTTVFNAITGLYRPTSGEVKFNGILTNKLSPDQDRPAWDTQNLPAEPPVRRIERSG